MKNTGVTTMEHVLLPIFAGLFYSIVGIVSCKISRKFAHGGNQYLAKAYFGMTKVSILMIVACGALFFFTAYAFMDTTGIILFTIGLVIGAILSKKITVTRAT